MKKILQSLFFVGAFFLFLPKETLAADLNIDCPASPTACSKSGLDPLFSNNLDGFWYPGKSITKTLNLKNSGPETREMAIRGARTSGVSILENVMQISIVGGTTVIWSGSVANFYGPDHIDMGTFASGADLNYNFTVSMSSDADDNYQNKETVFDLTLGFWGEPVSTPTPTPGTVLGAGVSAPVCSDTKPVGAPTLLQAIAGVNSVQLIWSEGAGPISYYLVAFGLTSGSITYGNPNIGGAGTTNYTVNNLSGGTTYYFKVRAGNGCMPGDYSNEISATPTGISIAGPATGFASGVLGEATPSGELGSALGTEKGEVVGIETKPRNWWILTLIGLVGIGGFVLYLRFFHKK
ncbi:hypothetical protein AUJ42_03270 [Candidatus Collierbacteria bacterium CG1_02_44_10]|uniref:Fibronectin type-III domain-containing protein n=1 Tax=Candidatus Collierbacteria bacterium CG1_02_44_10 TaxID=1805087 RepID=A0A1J4RSF7_9BACT|nr:MAG: hypothetical protein AUJ42_03270 [Candidatus Collierbacteria bacterium CG1_02_44_10]